MRWMSRTIAEIMGRRPAGPGGPHGGRGELRPPPGLEDGENYQRPTEQRDEHEEKYQQLTERRLERKESGQQQNEQGHEREGDRQQLSEQEPEAEENRRLTRQEEYGENFQQLAGHREESEENYQRLTEQKDPNVAENAVVGERAAENGGAGGEEWAAPADRYVDETGVTEQGKKEEREEAETHYQPGGRKLKKKKKKQLNKGKEPEEHRPNALDVVYDALEALGGNATAMQLAEAAGEHGVSDRAAREAADMWITLGIMTLSENKLVFCEGIG